MATYKCTQCGHENENERVYCHNCGTKLDRALLPQDEKQKNQETPEKARKRVLKMTNPAKGLFTRAVAKQLFQTIACALVIAVVAQAVRPPENIPPVMKDLIDVPPIAERLEDEIATPQSHQLAIPEDIANGYLQKTVKTRDAQGRESSSYLKFERAFLHFDDGICNMNLKLTIFDWPLYATNYYQLAIEGGELRATSVGGAIGRMPVHPSVMKFAGAIFKNLWEALKREKKLLDQMKSVEVKKGQIVLTTNPAKPGPPGR